MENQEKKSEWKLCKDEYTGEDTPKPYYFINSQGEILANKRFGYAEPFSDGFALVKVINQPYVPGLHYFIDENGEMSEPFYKASSYKNGFALIQTSNNKYLLRDRQGNLSEQYYSVRIEKDGYYKDGYAVVETEWGEYRLRNLKGELSETTFGHELRAVDCVYYGEAKYLKFISKEPDKKSKQAETEKLQEEKDLPLRMCDYFDYELSIYDLSPEEILTYLDKILEFEKKNYLMALEHCKDRQEMENLYQNYLAVAEYIKQTAYEASKKKNVKETEEKDRKEFREKPLF